MNKNEQASKETVEKLLEIARKKFSEKGFAKTSLNEIVQEMGMTRGAFYHHFSNKETLFLAVLEEIHEELGDYVEGKASEEGTLWGQLEEGCIAFVEYAIRPEIYPILLIDSIMVMSWSKWKEMDENNSQTLLQEIIMELVAAGEFQKMNVDYATVLISGGLNELAMKLVNQSENSAEEFRQAIHIFLKGFRSNG
ncbi:TetR/AcrR family transcriptional regulator [Fundicoccus sp. Sow4_H7]|uniref:TetR/AcrR family transcriptional regulator n=1 Tax=Fundicoccus sp. Sow4_H7 TaxID=3438784 RepID=UPI003F920014